MTFHLQKQTSAVGADIEVSKHADGHQRRYTYRNRQFKTDLLEHFAILSLHRCGDFRTRFIFRIRFILVTRNTGRTGDKHFVSVAIVAIKRRMCLIQRKAGLLVVELLLPVFVTGFAIRIRLHKSSGCAMTLLAIEACMELIQYPAGAPRMIEGIQRFVHMARTAFFRRVAGETGLMQILHGTAVLLFLHGSGARIRSIFCDIMTTCTALLLMTIHTLESELPGMVAMEKGDDLSLHGIRFVHYFRRDGHFREGRALPGFYAGSIGGLFCMAGIAFRFVTPLQVAIYALPMPCTLEIRFAEIGAHARRRMAFLTLLNRACLIIMVTSIAAIPHLRHFRMGAVGEFYRTVLVRDLVQHNGGRAFIDRMIAFNHHTRTIDERWMIFGRRIDGVAIGAFQFCRNNRMIVLSTLSLSLKSNTETTHNQERIDTLHDTYPRMVYFALEERLLSGTLMTGKIITAARYNSTSIDMKPTVTEISPIDGKYDPNEYGGV